MKRGFHPIILPNGVMIANQVEDTMKRADKQPTSDLTLFAGIYLRIWTIEGAGTTLPQHAHRWPHVSLVSSGAVRVTRGDEDLGEFHAPATVKIPANTKHTFVTLSCNTVICCVHATDAAEVEIAEEHQLALD